MAWFHSVCSSGRPADLLALLRSRGLEPGTPKDSSEPGLILAGGPSAELEDAVRSASRIGTRVLVAFSPDAAPADPWLLLRLGAGDVVRLSADSGLDMALARLERWSEVDHLIASEQVRRVACGDAPCWRAALQEAIEIARFTPSPILITGETGTGKEVVARLVHTLDTRTNLGDLVLVDCTTVVPSLSGSEFFGHEKGAFTGATSARSGAFARADGGTLFLDEVGELPLPLQAELLRVVQEGLYKPLGGNHWRSTAFRLLAATNRDLPGECRNGRFRSDLYFRLAGAMVHLPPLRERVEDIVPLFRRFFAEVRGDGIEPELDPAVAQLLQQRSYPGNVRDLRQLAVRVATRHVGDGPVTPGDVPPGDRAPLAAVPPATGEDESDEGMIDLRDGRNPVAGLEQAIGTALASGIGLKDLKSTVADLATRIALEQAGGPTAAARLLGVSRRAVDYRKAATRDEPDSGR